MNTNTNRPTGTIGTGVRLSNTTGTQWGQQGQQGLIQTTPQITGQWGQQGLIQTTPQTTEQWGQQIAGGQIASQQVNQPLATSQFVGTTTGNAGLRESIKGESRIEYVPYEKAVVEYEEVQRVEYIPKQKKVTDYMAVEYVTEYVPQTYQDRYIEYVPQERVVERVEYVPVERQLIHYPQEDVEQQQVSTQVPVQTTGLQQPVTTQFLNQTPVQYVQQPLVNSQYIQQPLASSQFVQQQPLVGSQFGQQQLPIGSQFGQQQLPVGSQFVQQPLTGTQFLPQQSFGGQRVSQGFSTSQPSGAQSWGQVQQGLSKNWKNEDKNQKKEKSFLDKLLS